MKKLILLCTLFIFSLHADLLELEGYLGKDEVKKAEKSIKAIEGDQLVVVLNSSSGDLGSVLELAKTLYAVKAEKGIRVIVYIDQNAVGPAAVIPFVADQLFISYFASWGDIPLGSDDAIPTNLLRNTVKSLISSKLKHRQTMEVIASAMSDPGTQVVDQNGWKIGDTGTVISPDDETLVINHNQMVQLGLVNEIISPLDFKKQFQDEKKGGTLSEEKFVESPELSARLKKYLSFTKDGKNTIGLIRVDNKNSQISQATWIYVKSALEHYKKVKPSFIILELNTPGG